LGFGGGCSDCGGGVGGVGGGVGASVGVGIGAGGGDIRRCLECLCVRLCAVFVCVYFFKLDD